MRRPTQLGPIALLVITLTVQAGCERAAPYRGLTPIDGEWVERLCESISKNCLEIDEINRSSDGRELRVVFRAETVVIAASGTAQVYKKPRRVAWMNDAHEWIASSDDLKHGFYLLSESSRTHAYGYPKFDSGGRFFAVTQGDETVLYRVKPYRQEAVLPLNVASNVFVRPPFVFVIGPDREVRRLRVYTYRDNGENVDFVSSRVIERPNGGSTSPFYVSDVAASGELFAIHDVSSAPVDAESTVLIYESTANQLKPTRKGTLPWATLFLSDDLHRRVRGKPKFTLAPSASASLN